MIRLALTLSLLAAPVLAQVPPCGLYTYRAQILRVIDGDTVVADIDLGFDIWLRSAHLRLAGIDAPELDAPGGPEAASALRDRVEGRRLYICTQRMKTLDREARGSFGRYLVTIYDGAVNVNDWLIESGRAVVYE